MTTVAIVGAAGNMGTRTYRALKGDSEYRVLCVESTEGEAKLRERGIAPTPMDEALEGADVAVMTVPDRAVGAVLALVVPGLKAGAMVMCLDPAGPYAGKLPDRKDVTYFVTHPTHPPLFVDEADAEARRDFFGSGKARQSIVNSLVQGPEADYVRGEAIARKMFGPILRSHRVTLEQMALLEPAMAETVAATCISVVREAMDEVIERGVPAEAARDFMLGHVNIELAILFDELDWDFSAGAKLAIAEAKKAIFQADWKKVFDQENLKESVARIVGDA